MIALNLVGLRPSVEPAVHGGKGHPKALRQFFLGQSIFQAINFQFFHKAIHGILIEKCVATYSALAHKSSEHHSGRAMGRGAKTKEKQLVRHVGSSQATEAISAILRWYFDRVYGHLEGPGKLPFYCDPAKIGHFAIAPADLASGKEASLFRLLVTMAMFQARRDVVIMAQQRSMPSSAALHLTSPQWIQNQIHNSPCKFLAAAESFDRQCTVAKQDGTVTCARRASCHVKEASTVMLRMGDMGKLPTSAWLHCWQDGQLAREYRHLLITETDPKQRATKLMKYFERVYRVGQKLAAMFVSALSVPALAPGLTPWFPEVDGADLVVVDTNVAQIIDRLRGCKSARTYEARAHWLRKQAEKIDLSKYHPTMPAYSPRLVQQALYHFGSKSNRIHRGDSCSNSCDTCHLLNQLCPIKATPTGKA